RSNSSWLRLLEEVAAGLPGGQPSGWSRSGFEYEVERSLRSAPEAGESALGDDFAQPGFAGLRAERSADFLRKGCRRANQGGGGVEDAADRCQIVGDVVVGVRLDDQPSAVRREGSKDVAGSAGLITHVVQAVEERHQIVTAAGVLLGRRDIE